MIKATVRTMQGADVLPGAAGAPIAASFDGSAYAQNIVNTVREPLVVLDDEFRVVSANRSFYSTFQVTPETSEHTLLFDLGNGQWEIPRLRELLEEVLPKSTRIEDFEVEHDFPDIGQKTMLMNARRIQSKTGATPMILLAIEDITERKRLEDKLKDASEYAQNIVNTVREPLVVLDNKFRVISANRSFYSTFKVNPEMSENTLLFDLGDGQWNIPKLGELLEKVLPKSTTIEAFEVEHDFPAIGQKTMLLNARRIPKPPGEIQMILLAIEDITERKRLEEKLLDASEYAQNIIDTGREPLVVLDDKFRLLSANRSFYSTFKVTTEMSENTLLFDLGDGQWEIPRLRELLEKVLPKSTTIEDFEVEHNFPDIGQKTMLLNARRVQSKAGAAPMILLAIEDITERKRLEDKLLDASDYAQNIVNTVREPLVVLDDKFRVISANRSFYSTFKVTPEMSENTLLFDLGDGQWEIPRLRELLEKVLPKSTTIEDFEVEHNFPDIGQKTMLMNARRIQSKTGAAPMILLAIEDITERKHLEDKLQDASEYAQDIVSTVREPLVVLDDRFRVISANRSFYSTFDVTPEMSENILLFDLGNGQWEIPRLRELLEEVLPESTTIEDFEVEHNFPDIGQKTMLMNARRIQSKTGAAPMILLAIEDITERKRVEEKVSRLNTELRVHVDALESLNQELDSFSYSISHDLRAPLRAIEGFSEMLVEDHREILNDEGRRLLDVVSAQAEKMADLIEGLLRFSRTSREDLALGLVDMRALCGEVVAEHEFRITDRDVVFNVDELPPSLGDRQMLKQVFENLIGNAVKFTGTREQAVIEVGFQATEAGTAYFVRDNGVGFNMEYASNIFGVFQRYHSEKEFEGTGIGLSLVQKIVSKHGGTVRAEAEEDKGATFYFSLPQREEG